MRSSLHIRHKLKPAAKILGISGVIRKPMLFVAACQEPFNSKFLTQIGSVLIYLLNKGIERKNQPCSGHTSSSSKPACSAPSFLQEKPNYSFKADGFAAA